MTTPINMLQELQTWHSFTNEEMEKALATKPNKKTEEFVRDWSNGRYDEDIEQAKGDFLSTL